jgi:hypothetical protein
MKNQEEKFTEAYGLTDPEPVLAKQRAFSKRFEEVVNRTKAQCQKAIDKAKKDKAFDKLNANAKKRKKNA